MATVAMLFTLLTSCSSDNDATSVSVETVATGLLNPVGLAVMTDGSILIAEEGTGLDDASAGVSLIADGEANRVVSGLKSGRDSGDLSGVPLVGVAPDGRTIYTTHFGLGGLYTFELPESKSSTTVLGPDDLSLTMTPLNRVRLVNPFDIAFSPDGQPVVTDASDNGVAIRTAEGSTEFIHRFGELQDPTNDTLRIDPVPTGISRQGSEYFVSLTGGCPYPLGSGQVVAIDGQQNERLVVDGLNMPIDVAHDSAGTLWVLEFTRFDP
ncbi:MAG: ScyD/ScyE family protein, partial [Acidimicrobiia bacterium]|nr:ScyD/ScyE family protein [Acidimicrobiia bacterium]